MSELEKKLRELVGNTNNFIPTSLLFDVYALALYQTIYSTFVELKKGIEKND